MNKLFAVLVAIILLNSNVIAGGFEGSKKEQVDTDKWKCKFCPEIPVWDVELWSHLGIVSDENYKFSNYTGLDEDKLFFSGHANNINSDGSYWITNFKNIGTDAEELDSSYGIPGNFEFELDYKGIPVRKFDQLQTAFENPGSTVLRLDDAWSRSNNSADFSDPALFTEFALGTDWDLLDLNFSQILNSNFDYSLTYNRIEKNGLKESSANQYFQSVYIPLPVDSVIEDFTARIDYLDDDWFGSFALNFSKFENEIESVLFANPFTSLISGADATLLSDNPDNTSVHASLNVRYSYMPRSFIKTYLSFGLMQQDQQYLPYTTNLAFNNSLPQASLDGEIQTQNASFKINHWFSSQWSLRAQYKFSDRYNKTDMNIYRPVTSDLFYAGDIINIPYDFTRENANIDLDWRIKENHYLTLGIKNKKTERTFQTVRNTTEDSLTARYKVDLTDEMQVYFNAERSSLSGSAAELVDLISVNENPLLQRFNVSERDNNKFNMQFSFNPLEMPLSTMLTVQYAEDDYDNNELGLQYSWQNNISVDMNMHFNDTISLGIFADREIKETRLGGSEAFVRRDWLVNNDDEVLSYGINFTIDGLLDETMTITGSSQFSIADTDIAINNAGYNSQLPIIESLWTTAEIKADYKYSESTDFALSLIYQDFESYDFAIDNVVPGAAADLLTFSAMSNNYNISLLKISMLYRF